MIESYYIPNQINFWLFYHPQIQNRYSILDWGFSYSFWQATLKRSQDLISPEDIRGLFNLHFASSKISIWRILDYLGINAVKAKIIRVLEY